MKKFLKKLNLFLLTSALTAGVVFCMCGFTATLPRGVTVNGIPVGGLTRTAAAAAVRADTERKLKEAKLVISGKRARYEFSFPEIYYKDNLYSLFKSVKKDCGYTAEISYYLCGLNEVAAGICLNEHIEKVEPYAEFRPFGAPFSYVAGRDGEDADCEKLKKDVLRSLGNGITGAGFEEVKISYIGVKRNSSLAQIRMNTVLLGKFSTVYDAGNTNRASNIRLAAEKLNGSTLAAGEVLSFNSAVGARLPERGFLPAKIIENGEYTEGVGGGVCQVSTTLYNAALLSGMEIVEYHPHSLPVGYVDPSRDAMVSGNSCDLKFKNPSALPVYIRAHASDGTLEFEIYGKSDGAVYSLESIVTGNLPAPEEKCGDPALARPGKDGILSEGYLVVKRGCGEERIKLRSDKYMPQKRVVYFPEDAEEDVFFNKI